MSNLAFRPRPIDINKPLPIIRTPIVEEECAISRSVPKMPTGMELEEEEEHHIQAAIAASLEPSSLPEIPTPRFTIVPDYDSFTGAQFQRTQAYVLYSTCIDDRFVEYELDIEDEQWLEQYNTANKANPLADEKMEAMIIKFERDFEDGVNKPPKTGAAAAVYQYWWNKRQRQNTSLVQVFRDPPAYDDPNPYVAFRPRQKTSKLKKLKQTRGLKNDSQSLVKMKQMRQEFERARMLLEMIKKREKLKKEQTQLFNDTFEIKYKELRQSLLEEYPDGIYTKGDKRKHKHKRKRRHEFESGMESPTSSPELSSSSYSPSSSPVPSPPASPRLSSSAYSLAMSSFPLLSASASSLQLSSLNLSTSGIFGYDPLYVQKPKRTAFPLEVDGVIHLGPDVPPFRGRGRVGRGGRIIWDRFARVPKPPTPTLSQSTASAPTVSQPLSSSTTSSLLIASAPPLSLSASTSGVTTTSTSDHTAEHHNINGEQVYIMSSSTKGANGLHSTSLGLDFLDKEEANGTNINGSSGAVVNNGQTSLDSSNIDNPNTLQQSNKGNGPVLNESGEVHEQKRMKTVSNHSHHHKPPTWLSTTPTLLSVKPLYRVET